MVVRRRKVMADLGCVPSRGRERERDRRSVHGQAAMIRIAITAQACAAIEATVDTRLSLF
jgi:hypothetical protein